MLDVVTIVTSRETAPQRVTVAISSGPGHGDFAAAVQQRFAASSHFELRSVTCEQRVGVLVLRGRVSSYYQKQLAQEVVRQIAGLLTIQNAVEVIVPDGAKVERLPAHPKPRAAEPKQEITL